MHHFLTHYRWKLIILLHRCGPIKRSFFLISSSDEEEGQGPKFGRMDDDNMQDKERFARWVAAPLLFHFVDSHIKLCMQFIVFIIEFR